MFLKKFAVDEAHLPGLNQQREPGARPRRPTDGSYLATFLEQLPRVHVTEGTVTPLHS